MSTEITVAIIAFAGILLSAIAAFIGSSLGHFINLKIAKQATSDKYALAALDKKMEIHQEAFNRALDFQEMAHLPENSVEKNKQYTDHLKWWRENCLYLEPESRKVFIGALTTANIYYLRLSVYSRISDRSSQEYKKARKELYEEWNRLFDVTRIIEDGVSKPLIQYDVKSEFSAEGKIK